MIKDRVLQIAEYKGVAKQKFCEEIGMTYGSFTGKAKESPLNSNAIGNILLKYPDINPDWLITGTGSIVRDDYNSQVLREPKAKYVLRTDTTIDQQSIPLYNIEAAASLVELFRNHNDEKAIDTIRIPNLPKCDGAVYVTGDSMYPLLKSGDIVMYEQIHNFLDGLFWGEMYLISIDMDGEEYVAVKFIQKSENGKEWIKLVSQNSNHQPKDVHLDKVRALALVKASIRINSMN